MILTGLAVVVGAVALVALLVKLWSVSQIKKFYRVKGKGDKYMGSAGVTGMLKMLLPYPGKTKLSNSQRQMEEYLKNGRKDGVMHSFFGPFNAIVVADPEVIKYIIMNPKKFPKQTMGFQGTQVGDFLGNSIVFTEGEEWKAQRHVINPAFYDIELFYKPFGELIDKCLAKWAVEVKKNGGKAAINIPTDMTNMTIDILGRTVFGHDFGALEGKLDDYVESYMFLMSSLNNPIRMFVKFLGKLPTQYNKDMKYHLKRFDDMINKLIEDRRVKLAQDVEKKELEKTLLDLMIESQDTNNTLTNQQLRDNMVVFFVAGHETTASALGFVFYNLGKHLRVQEKLVEEIQNTCGLDTAPTYDQLNAMEYLNDVIKESMRLYSPTGGVTPKAAAEDCELGGYHVPKGTLISLSLWCAHHTEENYGPDVMEFRPERWQGEEGKKIHKFANIPFSAGSRVCIGNNFSLVEQRLFIVKLLQRYSVALTPGYKFKLEPGSTLHHMESDFEIILKQRQ